MVFLSETEKKEYFRGYYEARRNRLRHIRQTFQEKGKHIENKCEECKTKKVLEWRQDV